MEKINEANLRAVLRRINEATGEDFNLGRWAPGDGCTRYRVESADGSRTPFGPRYWLGRTEAYWGLHTICNTLEYVSSERMACCHRTPSVLSGGVRGCSVHGIREILNERKALPSAEASP